MGEFLLSLSDQLRVRLREVVLFLLIGVMNTAIDFGVLNLLIALTYHHSGWWLLTFNGLSFLAAVSNSYVLNGRVTFRYRELGDALRFTRFIGVNAMGLAINSGIVVLMAPILEGRYSSIVAINASKALAVFVSLCWNYLGSRRWIFVSATK